MTINRTSDGYGFVGKMGFSELKKYNFGTSSNPSKISLLRDILKVVPLDKIVLIEVKCEICEKVGLEQKELVKLKYVTGFAKIFKGYKYNAAIEKVVDERRVARETAKKKEDKK